MRCLSHNPILVQIFWRYFWPWAWVNSSPQTRYWQRGGGGALKVTFCSLNYFGLKWLSPLPTDRSAHHWVVYCAAALSCSAVQYSHQLSHSDFRLHRGGRFVASAALSKYWILNTLTDPVNTEMWSEVKKSFDWSPTKSVWLSLSPGSKIFSMFTNEAFSMYVQCRYSQKIKHICWQSYCIVL